MSGKIEISHALAARILVNLEYLESTSHCDEAEELRASLSAPAVERREPALFSSDMDMKHCTLSVDGAHYNFEAERIRPPCIEFLYGALTFGLFGAVFGATLAVAALANIYGVNP